MVFVHMTLSCRFVCVFLCHADIFIMCRFLKFSHEIVEVVPQTSYKNKAPTTKVSSIVVHIITKSDTV